MKQFFVIACMLLLLGGCYFTAKTIGTGAETFGEIQVMKMEATIYAEHDGEIGQVLIKARDCVEARDLLIVYK